MTGDSNKSGGGSDDDLLSQLLDLEEDQTEFKDSSESASFEAPTKGVDGFRRPNQGDDFDRDNQTEVLSNQLDSDDLLEEHKEAGPSDLSKEINPEVDPDDLLGDLDIDIGVPDRTEVLHKPDEKKSLDQFLGQDTEHGSSEDVLSKVSSANEDATEFIPSTEVAKNANLEDELFNSDDAAEATAFDDGPREKTIVLSDEESEAHMEAAENSSSSSSSEVDPIDAALAEFADQKSKVKEPAESKDFELGLPETEGGDESEITDLFDESADPSASASAKELSEEDFADVFQSGPIQVPDQPSKISKIASKKSLKYVSLAAGILVVVAGLGFGVVQFRSDEGLLGYRMDGFAIGPVYKSPDAATLAMISKVLEAGRSAVIEDDPKKLVAQLKPVEDILIQDERNLESVALHLELLGILMAWEGLKPELSAQFDQQMLKANEIKTKLKEKANSFDEQILRAKTWRLLGAGSYSAALKEFESQFAQTKDDFSFLVLGELNFRLNNTDNSKKFLSQISNKEMVRAQYRLALIENDQKILAGLSKTYLPAEVDALLLSFEAKDNSGREQLAQLDRKEESVQAYPWLLRKIQRAKGDLFHRLGDHEKAREQWLSIVDAVPGESEVWLKLAKSYEEDSLWDKSIEAYRRSIKEGGRNKPTSLALIRILRLRLKVVEALEEIEIAIQTFPQAAEFSYEKGKTEMVLNQYDTARASFESALTKDKNFIPATLSLAELAKRQEEWSEAEKLFQEVPKNSSYYAEALHGLGDLALAQHKMTEAKKFYALAIREDSKNVDAYKGAIRLLIRAEEDDKASALVEQGISLLPKNLDLRMAKARVLQFRGKYDEALDEVEAFFETHNHRMDLALLRADLLIDKREFTDAREILDQLGAKSISEPQVNYLLAKAYYQGAEDERAVLGSNEMAWRLINGIRGSAANKEDVLLLKAQLGLRLGERVTTTETIEKILSIYPDNAEAYSIRGDLLLFEGANDQALRSYQKALSMTRFKGEIYRKLAQLYSLQADTAQAIKYWTRVAQWFPSDGKAQLELGKLYNDQGQYGKAVASFKKAIQIDERLSDAYYYLGFIEKDRGNSEKAVQHFERYLKLEPNGVEAATVEDEVFFLRNSQIQN